MKVQQCINIRKMQSMFFSHIMRTKAPKNTVTTSRSRPRKMMLDGLRHAMDEYNQQNWFRKSITNCGLIWMPFDKAHEDTHINMSLNKCVNEFMELIWLLLDYIIIKANGDNVLNKKNGDWRITALLCLVKNRQVCCHDKAANFLLAIDCWPYPCEDIFKVIYHS